MIVVSGTTTNRGELLMNRKVLGVLIALLMVASLVPLMVPAMATTAVTQNPPSAPSVKYKVLPISAEKAATSNVNPKDKVNPELFKAVAGEVKDLIKTIDGKQYVPVYFVATDKVSVPTGIKVFGYANVDGFYVYNVMIPVGKDGSALLIKLASIPEVKTVNVVKPEILGGGNITEISVRELQESFFQLAKNYSELEARLKAITAHRDFVSKEYSKRYLLTWNLDKKVQDEFLNYKLPVYREDLSKVPKLQPDDFYVVKHNGAMEAWNEYNVNGSGVKIAIIDTGVDFGNPALMDAYAVDKNNASPYYGWPIMYDPGSLFQYLALNLTFPDSMMYGLQNEYANTSYITGDYIIDHEPYIVGYHNSTYNYTVVFSGMSLASIPNESARAKVMDYLLKWVASQSGPINKILVVDDDGGQDNGGYYLDFQNYYYQALDDLGINYDRVTISFNTTIPNGTLDGYDLVIMFTGEDSNPIVGNDTEVIANYLKNGGNLILFSSDYLFQALIDYYNNQTALANFTAQYFHINATLSMPDWGIPTVLSMGTFNVSVRRYDRGIGQVWNFTGFGFNLPFLVPSLIDLADVPLPMNGTVTLGTGYMALPEVPLVVTANYSLYLILPNIRLPMNNDLQVPLKSGAVHLGYHPDIFLALMNGFWLAPNVLVADTKEPGQYDKVYVSLTTDFGMFVDFNDDVGHGKDNPVVAWDLNGDGLPDISGGLVYYIADGKKPIPYSNVYYQRWHLANMGILFKVPTAGSLVAFLIDYYGIPHGTGCASSAAARGDRVYYNGIQFDGIMYVPAQPGEEYPIYGTAPGAHIMAVPLLTTWTTSIDWMSAMFFATSGYDGVPDTGDEAQIVSNSYGNSYTITKGFNFEDRFLYYLTNYFAPHVSILYAAGNGGPGYGTVTDEGASPGVITIGAATDSGWRVPIGWDSGKPSETSSAGQTADRTALDRPRTPSSPPVPTVPRQITSTTTSTVGTPIGSSAEPRWPPRSQPV